ncbi:MAG: V-type ATPase subunit, partial [Synergistaceae bacterium]|nr:V-type ATPase subunit [Synergistaceae bacterium]
RLYLSANSKISYDSALLSRNFAELSDALRESVYYRVLAEPLRRLASGEEKSLFPLEMALDLFVELSLHKALKKLGPDDRNRLIPIFGVRLDLYNIYILYRARTFYDMTPEEILNRLPPSRFRVTMESLRGMVRLDIDHLAEFLKNRFPQYAQLFVSALPDKNTQLSMERNIKRHIYSQARNVYGSGPPGFHTAVSYYVLKEFEISDIVRIIEYVRYGHERRDAAAYLTRPIISTGGETEWQ